MIVAVGSTRGPKIEALHRTLARLRAVAPALSAAEVVAREVGDVGPATPLALEEILAGSRARARRALEIAVSEGYRPNLGVGLEGGIDVRVEDGGRRGFLMSWAFVTDGQRGAHGCGGALELPPPLLEQVVDRGVELSRAVDAFVREDDVRSRQGTWGILTRGLMDRASSFEVALINALAPFYNAESYR